MGGGPGGGAGALAWLLVAVLLLALGSSTSPAACSSRVLPAEDGDVMVRAAGAGGAYGGRGGERVVVGRSLLQRAASRPPSPVPNPPRATVAPGTPPRKA
ncbi:hypothetical protein CFC21_101391 [Triticum aestivum]|uniref:Uncharacterized protein n=2 Tax=Triticum aestivum TaxID=4565 RepID=A0A3B6SCI3_WHEAT|nr:hypothetical protein CFC21_101391 [Triticum aestivum]